MTFYTPLPESSIRLLELLPGHGGITINIHHVSLSVESTSFEALSYAWGIEERTKTIHISRKDLASASSCPFSVSPHLYSALESLRATAESGKPRWLWIDAICINQQDNDGKAMQVAMMSDIYSRAERVVVWLGNAESGSEMVMSQMPNLTTKLAAIDNLAGVSYITASSFDLPPGHDPIWEACAAWYDRDWFRRLWVLQEYGLARDLIFLCGLDTVSGQDVKSFSNAFRETQLVARSRHSKGIPPDLNSSCKSPAWRVSARTVTKGRTRGVSFTSTLGGICCVERSSIIYTAYSGLFPNSSGIGSVSTTRRRIDRIQQSMTSAHMKGTPSGLPSFMSPMSGQAFMNERAGWPRDSSSPYYNPRISSSLSTPKPTLSHPDNIAIAGMIVDTITDHVHLEWERTYQSAAEDGIDVHRRNASELLAIESSCAGLAQKVGITTPSIDYCTALVANRDQLAITPYNPEHVIEDYEEMLAYYRKTTQAEISQPKELHPSRYRLFRYVSSLSEKWRGGRSFFTTADGRIGLGGWNGNIRAGDRVCVLFGAHQLFVLRETAVSGVYSMVGDASVYRLMDCEAFSLKDPAKHEQVFEIS